MLLTVVDYARMPVVGCSRYRLLSCAKNQISRGPEMSIHQLPETTVGIVYADFESILKHDNVMDTKQGVAAGSGELSSRAFQEHVHVDPDFSKTHVSYRGEDAAEMFVHKLQEEAKQLFDEYIVSPRPLLPLTVAELCSFHTAVNYHMQPTAWK